jgi:HEAT repeat protein
MKTIGAILAVAILLWAITSLVSAADINTYLTALNDSDSSNRLLAVAALGSTGDTAAIDPVVEAMAKNQADSSNPVYLLTLNKLGKTAIDPILSLLKNEDAQIRSMAALVLGSSKDARAIEPLKQSLSDRESNVRQLSALALGVIGDPQATDALIFALTDNDSSVRSFAAVALGLIGDEKAKEPLSHAIDAEANNSDFQATAKLALESLGKPQDYFITHSLDSKNDSVRFLGAFALMLEGDAKYVDSLEKALQDENSMIRYFSALSLAMIADSRAIDPLIKALEDNTSDMREMASIALGFIGEPALDSLKQAAKMDNNDTRQAAVYAMAIIGKPAEIFLIESLDDEDAQVKLAAVNALGLIGDAQAIEPLKQILNDNDSIVQLAASRAIERVDSSASKSIVNAEIVERIVWPKGSFKPHDQVAVEYTIKNTGAGSHDFYLGASVRGPDGEWQDVSYRVKQALEPGKTYLDRLVWRVPGDAPVGDYDITIAVWKDKTANGEKLVGELDRETKEGRFRVEGTSKPSGGSGDGTDGSNDGSTVKGEGCGKILRYTISCGSFAPRYTILADMRYKSQSESELKFKGVLSVRAPDGQIYSGSQEQRSPALQEDGFGDNRGNAIQVLIPEEATSGLYDARLELRMGEKLCNDTGWIENKFQIRKDGIAELSVAPEIEWEKYFESVAILYAREADGGFIALGKSEEKMIWIAKISANGEVLWEKSTSIESIINPYSISIARGTTDGGFILAGIGTKNDKKGIFLARISSAGEILWEKIFDSAEYCHALAVSQTSDGGFIASGSKGCSDNLSDCKGWFIRTSSNGNLIKLREFGNNEITAILEASDGYYLASTPWYSMCIPNPDGANALIKINENGDIIWERPIDGKIERLTSVIPASDGGVIAVGLGMDGPKNISIGTWIAKISIEGDMLWKKYVGIGFLFLPSNAIKETSNGAFLVTGLKFNNNNSTDIKLLPGWLAKATNKGDLLWEMTFDDKFIFSTQETYDGGLILAGTNGLKHHDNINSIKSFLIKLKPANKSSGSKPIAESLSINLPSPQKTGTKITWTAEATDPDGDPLLYRFMLSGPRTENEWQEVQGWGSSNTWVWDTTVKDVGENQVAVEVRDGKHAGEKSYDDKKISEKFAIDPVSHLWYKMLFEGEVYSFYITTTEEAIDLSSKPLSQLDNIKEIYIEDSKGNRVINEQLGPKLIILAQSSARLSEMTPESFLSPIGAVGTYSEKRKDKMGNEYLVIGPSDSAQWWRDVFIYSGYPFPPPFPPLVGINYFDHRTQLWEEVILDAVLQPDIEDHIDLEDLKNTLEAMGWANTAIDALVEGKDLIKLTHDSDYIKFTFGDNQLIGSSVKEEFTKASGILDGVLGLTSVYVDINADALRMYYLYTLANARSRERLDSLGEFIHSNEKNLDPALVKGFDQAKVKFEDDVSNKYQDVMGDIFRSAFDLNKAIDTAFALNSLHSAFGDPNLAKVALPYYLSYETYGSLKASNEKAQRLVLAAALQRHISGETEANTNDLVDLQTRLKDSDPKDADIIEDALRLNNINHYLGHYFYRNYHDALNDDFFKVMNLPVIRDLLKAPGDPFKIDNRNSYIDMLKMSDDIEKGICKNTHYPELLTDVDYYGWHDNSQLVDLFSYLETGDQVSA